MLEILKSPKMSQGYYETMLEWLRTQVLAPVPGPYTTLPGGECVQVLDTKGR
jgi:hypothetical protein